MATTTNYGWTTPDDTALVKDGAAAIRSLGSAIDTSLKTVSDGRGLVFISSTNFSSVANQVVSNCFSATYPHYKIHVVITGATADCNIFMKLRSGATDASTNYNYGITIVDRAAGGGTVGGNSVTTGFKLGEMDTASQIWNAAYCDISYPASSGYTTLGFTGTYQTQAGTYMGQAGGGIHTTIAAYDSLNLIASAGNITGNIVVYGYK